METLSLSRQFAMEAHARAIDSCDNVEELRTVAKSLLQAWQLQASMSEDLVAQLMGVQPRPAGL
ncbi:hypothetical protein [Cyanobium sp. NS01]|uniref:hypothetical protein n=2 Tax=unclassified Cyanobium TaxID=2627006 RepID=UPI001644F3D2|nr:hypothetical protein [Cyanobium sp. NS01]MBE9153765.1 hypothetical protein [Cyanobium sp. LEGE 06113]